MAVQIPEETLDQFMQGLDSPIHDAKSRREWCRLFLRDMLSFAPQTEIARPPDLVAYAEGQTVGVWLSSAKPQTDRCIVCPHSKVDHEYYNDQNWCRPCNQDEMGGPCSEFFMKVHQFLPIVKLTDECRSCKLNQDSNAHRDDFVRGK